MPRSPPTAPPTRSPPRSTRSWPKRRHGRRRGRAVRPRPPRRRAANLLADPRSRLVRLQAAHAEHLAPRAETEAATGRVSAAASPRYPTLARGEGEHDRSRQPDHEGPDRLPAGYNAQAVVAAVPIVLAADLTRARPTPGSCTRCSPRQPTTLPGPLSGPAGNRARRRQLLERGRLPRGERSGSPELLIATGKGWKLRRAARGWKVASVLLRYTIRGRAGLMDKVGLRDGDQTVHMFEGLDIGPVAGWQSLTLPLPEPRTFSYGLGVSIHVTYPDNFDPQPLGRAEFLFASVGLSFVRRAASWHRHPRQGHSAAAPDLARIYDPDGLSGCREARMGAHLS
jgi:hypothetical protein